MKVTIVETKEIEVKYVKVKLPIRYEEEDMDKDFPLREVVPSDPHGYDWWIATIEIDTGKILEWPNGKAGDFYMKVCDEGSYYLLNENQEEIAKIEQDYVPNKLLPPMDGFSDYVDFEIDESGTITNWYKNPILSEIFN